ncbi:hypothetical protein GGX14DRAFT_399734 [Mycena pura]|uniref:Uncharacterized protein n=1 Tax=Mycena pura TaxID=153505 RepID=A0AAD6V476_9AGAR|nr:hypothetical protein GGX14DRAFT_399734 [Mycena pura]
MSPDMVWALIYSRTILHARLWRGSFATVTDVRAMRESVLDEQRLERVVLGRARQQRGSVGKWRRIPQNIRGRKDVLGSKMRRRTSKSLTSLSASGWKHRRGHAGGGKLARGQEGEKEEGEKTGGQRQVFTRHRTLWLPKIFGSHGEFSQLPKVSGQSHNPIFEVFLSYGGPAGRECHLDWHFRWDGIKWMCAEDLTKFFGSHTSDWQLPKGDFRQKIPGKDFPVADALANLEPPAFLRQVLDSQILGYAIKAASDGLHSSPKQWYYAKSDTLAGGGARMHMTTATGFCG